MLRGKAKKTLKLYIWVFNNLLQVSITVQNTGKVYLYHKAPTVCSTFHLIYCKKELTQLKLTWSVDSTKMC